MAPEDERLRNQVERAREAGRAAFGAHDWSSDVLDLEHDSLVDTPTGVTDPVRRLRFVGHCCVVEIDVSGAERLSFDVRVTPNDDAVVEMDTMEATGRTSSPWSPDLTVYRTKPRLTSFTVRWADSTRRPARTAWVLI